MQPKSGHQPAQTSRPILQAPARRAVPSQPSTGQDIYVPVCPDFRAVLAPCLLAGGMLVSAAAVQFCKIGLDHPIGTTSDLITQRDRAGSSPADRLSLQI